MTSAGTVRKSRSRPSHLRAAGTARKETAGTRALCPRCGASVLATPAGLLLEAEPHPLALTLPDGSQLTLGQAVEQARGKIPPVGHHVHVWQSPAPGRAVAPGYGCHPAQLALFAS